MTIWKQLRNISLCIPEELLAGADEAAKQEFMSRSEYIRFLINKDITKRKLPMRHNGQADPLWFDVDDS